MIRHFRKTAQTSTLSSHLDERARPGLGHPPWSHKLSCCCLHILAFSSPSGSLCRSKGGRLCLRENPAHAGHRELGRPRAETQAGSAPSSLTGGNGFAFSGCLLRSDRLDQGLSLGICISESACTNGPWSQLGLHVLLVYSNAPLHPCISPSS